MKLCIRGCGRVATRPVRKKKPSVSYCQPCWQAMPCNQRAQWGSLNPTRKTKIAVGMRRRVKVRHRYFYLKTDEQAHAIRAHIKKRKHEFESRLKARAQVEGVSAGGVSAQAGDRAD